LARTVRADDPDDAAGRQSEIERLDQQSVFKSLCEVPRLDHQVAEPRSGRQYDLSRFGGLLPTLGDEGFIGRQPSPALRLARPRALPHPFEFPGKGSPTRFPLPPFLFEPLLLLLEPARVIALERDPPTAIEFEDPARHLIEKITIMGDGHDGARIVLQEALQPTTRFP